MAALPLEGVRVADITVVWAGPYVTQLLAEWGAEVIRVEPRTRIQPLTRGADMRPPPAAALRQVAQMGMTMLSYPDFDPGDDPWNRSPGFNSHARNKLSMTADVMTPEGRESFLQLIELSDVFVENNVPETIERAGLTYDVLKQRNPNLIMLRMPAFGLSGPYKNYRALGTHIEGMIGHHYLRSYVDETPEAAGDVYTGDAMAGVMGAFAVAMALRVRRRTGRGQMIEMAQAENFLPVLGEFILDWTANHRDVGPQGNQHRFHAPHGYYPCRGDDRWIGIDCDSDRAWSTICEILGADDLKTDERFRDGIGRFTHRVELDREMARYTQVHEDRSLFFSLQNAGVIAGPVQSDADALSCPQLNERGFFEDLPDADFGTRRYPGLIFGMRRTPNQLRRAAPKLGQDNDYVYREILRVSDEEYLRLNQSEQVGQGYAPGVVPWLTPESPP